MHPQFVPAINIVPGANRHRRTFKRTAIEELAISIGTVGLLHPIVVAAPPTDTGWLLIAGERRLRAIIQLYTSDRYFTFNGLPVTPGDVPVTMLSDLDPQTMRLAELDENIRRVDISWQEQTLALAELHELRSEQAKAVGRKHTIADTAAELIRSNSAVGGRSRSPASLANSVTRAVRVKQWMNEPDVANARNITEAARNAERRAKYAVRSERVRARKSSLHRVHKSTFTDFVALRAKPARTDPPLYDCIIADPPYGINADQHGWAGRSAAAGVSRAAPHLYDDSDISLALEIISALPTLAKPKCILYMFCSIKFWAALNSATSTLDDWQVWPVPVIWHSANSGHIPWGPEGLRRSYDALLVARHGKRPFTRVMDDVISVPRSRPSRYAAEKPVELYRRLLERACLPGDAVLDPCAGSGTVFTAAEALKLRATGVEPNEAALALISERLEEIADN